MHKNLSGSLTWFCLCLLSMTSTAQEKVSPSNSVSIQGKVKKELIFTLKEAGGFHTVAVDSLVIYNHLHVRKRGIRNIKGILLKELLDSAGIDAPNPKLLSEVYVTCVASDGYKIVFSWNEIFNTDAGNYIMIATEEDGLKGEAMPDRILLLAARDINTGRRFMKGLTKIVVER